MSSGISLIPINGSTSSNAGKKRKPSFRPGGRNKKASIAPRKKITTKNSVTPRDSAVATLNKDVNQNQQWNEGRKVDLEVNAKSDETALLAAGGQFQEAVAVPAEIENPSKLETELAEKSAPEPPNEQPKQTTKLAPVKGPSKNKSGSSQNIPLPTATARGTRTQTSERDDTDTEPKLASTIAEKPLEVSATTTTTTTTNHRKPGSKVLLKKKQNQEPNTATSAVKPKRKYRKRKSKAKKDAETDAGGEQKEEEAPSVPAEKSLRTFCTKFKSKRDPQPKDTQQQPQPPPEAEDEQPKEEEKPSGPQVQIIDGEIVLQESSILVPNARKTVAEVEEEFTQVVEEEGHTSIVGASYNSFKKVKRKPQHWTVEDTKLFYTALRQVGTDFCTMEAFFKDRSRKQLKRKYQAELVKQPKLIELALSPKAKIPLDLSVFEVDKDSIVVKPWEPPTDVIPNGTNGVQEKEQTPEEIEEDTAERAPERQTIPPPSRLSDLFAELEAPLEEEFNMETEMGIPDELPAVEPAAEPIATAALTLNGTLNKAKSKKRKFRAGKKNRRL